MSPEGEAMGSASFGLRFFAPTVGWKLLGRLNIRAGLTAVFFAFAAVACPINTSHADEGGVGFWFPGLFGSLAAVPQVPGWALGIVDLYNPVSAGGNVAAARQITINNLPINVKVNLNASLNAEPNLVLVDPTYVFATPVFGGQLAVSLAGAYGRSIAGINGTLTESVGGITVTKQGAIEDGRNGFTDLYPEVALRWNSGVNNWMIYGMGDIPVGTYDSTRLANFSIGHGAMDGGVGYTYFDQKAGHEFSVVTGFTYNLVNPSTGYQNGVNWHLDWAASQFLTKTLQVGVVGYAYRQITPDRGCAAILCPNESQTFGAGPQLGIIIPGASMQTYLNFKALWDFDTQNRASGMSAWFTLSFSPPPPSQEKQSQPILTKSLPRN
jgi:hypothetical protein